MGNGDCHFETEVWRSQAKLEVSLSPAWDGVSEPPGSLQGHGVKQETAVSFVSHLRTSPATKAEPTTSICHDTTSSLCTTHLLPIRAGAADLCPAQPHAPPPTQASPAPALFAFHREQVLPGICAVFLITGFGMKCSCVSPRAVFHSHPLPAFRGIKRPSHNGGNFLFHIFTVLLPVAHKTN